MSANQITAVTTVLVPASAMFQGGAPTALVSLADVKEELQITDGASDSWLQKQITKASDSIGEYCNRIFQPQFYQDEIWAARDPYPWQVPGGTFPLQLAKWPLTAPPSPAGTTPPIAPTLASVAGGALAAQRYYVRIAYVTATGETAASLESNLLVAANNLLTVAPPVADQLGQATGWNCYVSKTANVETLQNATPLAMTANFTLPAAGLVAGAPLPNYILAVQMANVAQPLAEGVDFLADASLGQLSRLFIDGYVRKWPGLPTIVQYWAGFASIPSPVQDAAIELVKSRWYARLRDPNVKSENVAGVLQTEYWFGTGPGAPADMPNYVASKLDRFRVPVIA